MVTQDKSRHLKGDYVVYKKRGIYIIDDIRKEKIAGEQKSYYVLKSVYDANVSVYVPLDNEELVSRMDKVLSSDEIEHIIAKSHTVELKCCEDANEVKNYYEEIFADDDLSVVIALMKSLAEKKRVTSLSKGRFAAADERALGNCQKILCEAFAFSLGMEKGDIIAYIMKK